MIRVETNAETFAEEIEAEIAATGLLLDGAARGLAITAFDMLVKETPQWSGNAAANWNFSPATLDLSVHHEFKRNLQGSDVAHAFIYEAEAKAKGDPEAVDYAIGQNTGREAAVIFSTPVYLSNSSTNLSGESYISMLELNPNNFLRPENAPGHMVQNTILVLESLGEISTATAKALGQLTIGGLSGGPTQLGLF